MTKEFKIFTKYQNFKLYVSFIEYENLLYFAHNFNYFVIYISYTYHLSKTTIKQLF